jgi:Protein of unknown function (DUF3443)
MSLRKNSEVKSVPFLALVASAVILFGCGGGGGGGTNVAPPSTVAISISPTLATVAVGTTRQFSATVTGTSNQSVTWQVSGTPGGDSTHGMISTSGLYTAPATVPSPADVTVTVVSQADTTKFASATVTINANTAVNNVQAVQAMQGPGTSPFVNGLYTDVTICVPGTTSCQTISNIQIDTGSEGLRLLKSAVTLSLPAVTDASTNVLQECVQFADGSYIWGPIATADIQMAGEVAASNSVQLIPSPAQFTVPASCSNGGGPNLNNVNSLGANGIIGLGIFEQDCGFACSPSSSQVPAVYYLCPSSSCSVATVPLALQLLNPVWTFPQDNNGFLIALNSVPDAGAVSVSGTMTFGIGTQSNNGLGTAKIYTADPNTGNFQVTYSGKNYTQSYIDSGSNGLYLLDSSTLGNGITDCTANGFAGFYCTATGTTPINFTLTNKAFDGSSSGQVTIGIADAVALLNANGANNWAFDDLGGSFSNGVDYGLPFFFGRTIYIGIENQLAPDGVTLGPYYGY